MCATSRARASGFFPTARKVRRGTQTPGTRAAPARLEQMPPYVHYIGYVEGRDINRAKADVVVTDGFTGNVALKTMEGFASFVLGNLREVFGNGIVRRILYFLF